MADVFISYASEDRDRVRPLAEALEGRGFSIWWDRALASGQDYASIIDRELHQAKAVVVVWTAGSAASTFVRDEAGRARDEGRLLPVLLDRVPIPLGFGSYQAEDFTNWNGQRGAAQVQLLEESIKAKLEGRDVDSAAVQRKRHRLGARIRLVSLLTVIALVVGIAVGLNTIFNPAPPPEDMRAQLLRLLEEGKLTPEQAIQLAQILETGALGEQTASASGQAAPSASVGARSVDEGGVQPVSDQQFEQAAHASYDEAMAALLTHQDAGVRTAAVQMADASKRDAAMQTLWQYAQTHPDDPSREQIYLVCSAVGERNDLPLAQRALEAATNVAPSDPNVWRMLSHHYGRTNRAQDAQAAAEVGAGVEAQAQGQTAAAEQHLADALPNLSNDAPRAAVAANLGGIAEQRQDWTLASRRFNEAYEARQQTAQAQPNSPAATELRSDAQRLVTALDRSGQTRQACTQLQQAQEAHDVDAPDQTLVERCQRDFRVRLRAGASSRFQRAPVATTTTTSP